MGGSAMGGSAMGGSATGGSAMGGAAMGGMAMGGMAMGGAPMGGNPDECVCEEVFDPVCAQVCDDAGENCVERTFDNACFAACADVVGRPGACEEPNPQECVEAECLPSFKGCRTILNCFRNCPAGTDPATCLRQCERHATVEARAAREILFDCASNCDAGDPLCVDRECADEIRECDAVQEAFTCASGFQCLSACADDACRQTCLAKTDTLSRPYARQLHLCAEENQCGADADCLQANCALQRFQCDDLSPPGMAQCNGDRCDTNFGPPRAGCNPGTACEDMCRFGTQCAAGPACRGVNTDEERAEIEAICQAQCRIGVPAFILNPLCESDSCMGYALTVSSLLPEFGNLCEPIALQECFIDADCDQGGEGCRGNCVAGTCAVSCEPNPRFNACESNAECADGLFCARGCFAGPGACGGAIFACQDCEFCNDPQAAVEGHCECGSGLAGPQCPREEEEPPEIQCEVGCEYLFHCSTNAACPNIGPAGNPDPVLELCLQRCFNGEAEATAAALCGARSCDEALAAFGGEELAQICGER